MLQVAPLLGQGDQEGGQALVDQHGGMAQGEVVLAEGRQLHGVLDEAWPGGQPRPGKAGHARIVVPAAMEDAVEIQPALGGHGVELVDRGELDVVPGVGHELAKLGLGGRHLDELRREKAEEPLDLLQGRGIRGADDLGQLPELAQAVALGHALGTEGDEDVARRSAERTLVVFGGARKDRAAEDEYR